MAYAFTVGYGIRTTPWVEGIGYTRDAEHSTYGPCLRKGCTIHYVLNGKGTFNGNPVTKGQGFLIYDKTIAEHIADEEAPWELLWITLTGRNAKELLEEYNADSDTGIFNFTSSQLVAETAKSIRDYNEPEMSSTKLLEIFLRLHNNCIKQKKNELHTFDAQSYVDWAINYIKTNIYRDVTVTELTTRIGISQPYLYKLFRERFNQSPKQYIMSQKIEIAKNLLTDTDMTVTEIANSVGYQDLLTFSRMFLTKEKISPQKYRKKQF